MSNALWETRQLCALRTTLLLLIHRKRRGLCSLTPLEAAAVEALRPIEPELPSDPSLSLALWWDGLARRWAEQPELRLRPSPLGALARCIIDSYLQAIDWQRLAQALRGE